MTCPKTSVFYYLSYSILFLGDAYNTEERMVVAGYDNGDIKMFDLKKMAVRWETNLKNGVCYFLYNAINKFIAISSCG